MSVCLAPYNCCAIRITRLLEDGEPDFGADAYSVHVPISITQAVLTYEKPQIQQANGCGDLCVNVPASTTVTGYTITQPFCEDDFELWAAISGGLTVLNGPDVVGWRMPDPSVPPPPVCVEAWQQTRSGDNIGTLPGGAQAYKWHCWPYVTFTQGDQELANSNTVIPWVGTTSVNDQIGATGPFGDWLAPVNGPKGEDYWDELPDPFCGMLALVS